jgi:uncharacterized protein (TIGR02145 family)
MEKEQFCDERDGKKYVYVKIGTQTWMAENLNYNAEGSRCFSESHCEKYGKWYTWAMAMNNSASSTANPSGVRGVCPNGWHLPSQAEWDVIGNDAKKLKATSGWNDFQGKPGIGTDDYGFSALGGGYGQGGSSHSGGGGYWWTTYSGVRYRYINYQDYASWYDAQYDNCWFSVRCVQD